VIIGKLVQAATDRGREDSGELCGHAGDCLLALEHLA
jgi:hypothetical protein